MMESIHVDSAKAYSKEDIKRLLQMNDAQLKKAEDEKLLIFSQNKTMYGVYFFQFLVRNCKRLEDIQKTV